MRAILGTVIGLTIIMGIGCESPTQKKSSDKVNSSVDTAQYLVDQMIAYHGGDAYPKSKISFTFRGRDYKARKGVGEFEYQRKYADSLKGDIYDVLTNEGFVRKIDGEEAELTEKQYSSYSNSLNSVVYFAFLPYGLNDPAVNKEYLGISSIKGQSLEKVKVTFAEEGGGDDFDDTYVYWIDSETFQLMYLAYEFHVDDGGLRFRAAKNVRRVEGILFMDYTNYKADMEAYSVFELDKRFEEGKLDSLSDIRLEDIEVSFQ